MRIEYHPAVATELEEIRDYYETCSSGLGRDFVDEFERMVLRVAAQPQMWMVVRNDIRRALMKRFPYVIYFRVIGAGCLRITVVKHEKRHPGYGAGRQ